MISDEPRVLLRAERLNKDCRLGSKSEAAVSDLDIKIMQGEFVIVEGLRGIQKNAFFNLLGCLERPDSGKYFFDYEDIALANTKLLDELRRNKIGYLFRDFNLIPRMSAVQNLEVPLMGVSISRQEKKDKIKAALEKLELLELSEEKAGALSDFNKQMVSLARAIVNNPLKI
jgi:putative ABC transport system ATP-binding protein